MLWVLKRTVHKGCGYSKEPSEWDMLWVLKRTVHEICCRYLKNRLDEICCGYSKSCPMRYVVGTQKNSLDEICCRYSKELSRWDMLWVLKITVSMIRFFWAPTSNEALPGVLGNRGKRVFISGEQGNKGKILRGKGEQKQYWGTGNIRKQIFDFGEQGKKPI